jgi:hypothetical protein
MACHTFLAPCPTRHRLIFLPQVWLRFCSPHFLWLAESSAWQVWAWTKQAFKWGRCFTHLSNYCNKISKTLPVEQHNQHGLDPKEDNKNNPNHLTVQHIGAPCRIFHKNKIFTVYLHKCIRYGQGKANLCWRKTSTFFSQTKRKLKV